MRISVIFLYIFIIISAIKGIAVIEARNNYCSSTAANIVYVCTHSTEDSDTSEGVYVDSGRAPKLQRNNCTCTITPASTTRQTSLDLQLNTDPSDYDINSVFKIKELTLNYSNVGQNVLTVNISEDTSLIYTSQSDTQGGACLWIGPKTDSDNFQITCVQATVETDEEKSGDPEITTTLSDPHTDAKNTSNSDPHTDVTSSTNIPIDGNKSDMILIGAIVGGIVGLILIVLAVVVLIICCKRKRKPDPTETNDDDAYGMQDNGHFGDVVAPKAIEDHYTELDFTNKDTSSDYDYASHIADNKQVSSQKKSQHHEDDTYDHTVTSTSSNMTGNDYNHLPISQNRKTGDNDDYNVLNHK